MHKLSYSLNEKYFEHQLKEGITVIGRSPKCDIVINEPSISGTHMQFELSNELLICTDLNSSNGTAINGLKINKPTLIHKNDSLILGRIPCLIISDIVEKTTETPVEQAYTMDAITPDYVDAVEDSPHYNLQEEKHDYLPMAQQKNSVEVIKGGELYPETTTPVEPKKNKTVLIAAGIGIVFLSVILLLPSKKATNKPKRIIYSQTSYNNDLDKGFDNFRNRAYGKARKIWQKANTKWTKNHPKSIEYSIIAREMTRITLSLAKAEKNNSYLNVDWLNISKQIRNLIDDAVMTDNTQLFLDNFRKQVLSESANLNSYTQGKSNFEKKEYLEAQKNFASIPNNSHYFSDAKSMIDKCAKANFKKSVKNILSLSKQENCDWIELVKTTEELLNIKDDPTLSLKIVSWRKYAQQQKNAFRYN